MSEQSRLQRNKIFAKGLEKTATYGVMIGADILKFFIAFIKEILTALTGMKK